MITETEQEQTVRAANEAAERRALKQWEKPTLESLMEKSKRLWTEFQALSGPLEVKRKEYYDCQLEISRARMKAELEQELRREMQKAA